jgi:tetratricopeptide (TPR) repeat protein
MQARSALALSLLLFSGVTFADPTDDATKLKAEAVDILKANSNREASPAQYASCILKLEQAQQILEKAKQDDTQLAQEVSSTLFWARRFSDVNVLKELDKLRGGAAMPPPVKKSEPPKVVAKAPNPEEPDEEPDTVTAAKKAFESAQKFEREKAGDDYAIALRWFQMANEHSGTDYALKALESARAAQSRFAAKSATKVSDDLPDTPENKLLREADGLAAAGKYEAAFAIYQSSLKIKDSSEGHRRLGRAYFKRAQQIKDEFTPEYESLEAQRRAAWKEAWTVRRFGSGSRRVFNPRHPPLVEAMNAQKELVKKAYVSIEHYRKAEGEFKAVLKAAPNGKDLDAAGHACICLSVQGDPMVRSRAKTQLTAFLAEYKPVTDLERSLYEFCKTELQRIGGRAGN